MELRATKLSPSSTYCTAHTLFRVQFGSILFHKMAQKGKGISISLDKEYNDRQAIKANP